MAFAVFHALKGSGSGGGLGKHIDRLPSQEHTYKNADPSKRDLNLYLNCGKFSKIDLQEAIEMRIEEGYTRKKALRSDAVRHVSMVLTGSHEKMHEIFKDKQKSKDWINENYRFVCQEFGKENILRFVLHMDEKTPHLHAVVVPLTADGRLSAKEVLGDRIKMSKRQTRYAEQMRQFGLERGVIGSKAIHNSEGWYLGQQKKEQEAFLSSMPKFSLMDRIDPSRYTEKVKEGFKSLKKSKTDAELEASRRTKQLQTTIKQVQAKEEQNQSLLKEVKELKDNLLIFSHKLNGRQLKPEYEQKFTRLQENFKEIELKRQENQKKIQSPNQKNQENGQKPKGFRR